MLKCRFWLLALSLVVIGVFVGCGDDQRSPEEIKQVVTIDGGAVYDMKLVNLPGPGNTNVVKLMPIVLPDGG